MKPKSVSPCLTKLPESVADAFAPAVQGTLAKAVNDPRFKALLTAK